MLGSRLVSLRKVGGSIIVYAWGFLPSLKPQDRKMTLTDVATLNYSEKQTIHLGLFVLNFCYIRCVGKSADVYEMRLKTGTLKYWQLKCNMNMAWLIANRKFSHFVCIF